MAKRKTSAKKKAVKRTAAKKAAKRVAKKAGLALPRPPADVIRRLMRSSAARRFEAWRKNAIEPPEPFKDPVKRPRPRPKPTITDQK